ncbi:MAG: amino-acid N-acetyltransferase [Pseudomonadales bacterium]
MSRDTKAYVNWFRNSAPYIHANRNKTMVLMLGGEAAQHGHFNDIIHDIALLHSLGVKLVIVYGSRPQIDQRLQAAGIKSEFHRDLRITDQTTLDCVKAATGSLRAEIEALLSMGLANSPMHGARLRIASGNLISAKPVGILDGVDFHFTGEVRRVDCEGIRHQLNQGSIVLLPPLGYSRTGEVFNLSSEDLATEVAIALQADKLLLMYGEQGVTDSDGKLIRELNTDETQQLILDGRQCTEIQRHLKAAYRACHAGIQRTHLVSYAEDGALLSELYSRDGSGTLVTVQSYERIRQAQPSDAAGIIELIRPLEEKGVLVRRSRERLESEIERFTVIERDETVIGCAALYPFEDDQSAELACVVVHPDYQRANRGEQLLDQVVVQAKVLQLKRLLVLTTQTAHWFLERGFVRSSVDALPERKRSLYNWQRNSSVFERAL